MGKTFENKLSFFKNVFKTFSLCACILDSEMHVIYLNDALKERYPDITDPAKLYLLFVDVDKKTVINCLKSEKSYEFIRDLPDQNGAHISLSPLFSEENGEFEGAIAIISSKKSDMGVFSLGDEMACQTALNRELRDRINMMHSSIYAITQMKDFNPDKNTSILMNSLNQNCYQLLRASDNLSRIMRISLHNDYANFELINFADYVRKLIGTIILMDNKNSIPIKLVCEDNDLPAQIDLSRMEFVISNIILNSIKYTRKGNEITVTLKKVGDNAVLSIADKGVGMKKEILSKVGTPYYSHSNELDEAGFGIALFISKKYVSYHGGSFSIQSRKNSGTTVSISIPLDKEKEENGPINSLTFNSPPKFEPDARFSQTKIQLSEVCYYPVI